MRAVNKGHRKVLGLLAAMSTVSPGVSPGGSAGPPPAAAVPPPPQAVQELKDAVKRFGERGGLISAQDPFGDPASRLVYLEQGWEPAETLWYYHADQGSMLLPRDVLVHLEQPGSQSRITDPVNLSRFRFLNQRKTPNNPDALPVGFARHQDAIGLTCAACHTGQIIYRGTAVRIDGAPALVDMSGFFRQIEKALAETLADGAKLARFATASGRNPESARALLGESHRWFVDYNRVNTSTTVEGYGRLDAVGRILNQVIRMTSGSKNSLEPNAPNSFPLVWDAPRHDYVQWGGFSPNAGAGALGRNAGEVIGTYGRVEVKSYKTEAEAKKGYPSSIQGLALVAMEESLRKLKSPRWPADVLPPVDAKLAARGGPPAGSPAGWGSCGWYVARKGSVVNVGPPWTVTTMSACVTSTSSSRRWWRSPVPSASTRPCPSAGQWGASPPRTFVPPRHCRPSITRPSMAMASRNRISAAKACRCMLSIASPPAAPGAGPWRREKPPAC